MDAIIFDVDGTLWDSRVPVAHSWNDSVTQYTGVPSTFTPEYLGSFFGRTMDELLEVLLPGVPVEEQRAFGELCFRNENKWLEQEHGVLYPGVKETVEALSKRLPLYIVSNCQEGYIEVMLKTTGLGPYFKGHLCFGDTGKGKGENLVTLCRTYGLQDPVYVGDTQGDADACAEAGMPMIFATYGLGQVNEPWKQIESFPELLDLVNE